MSILGVLLFLFAQDVLTTKSDVGLLLWAVGGVMIMVSFVMALISLFRAPSRLWGAIALLVLIVGAVVSEVR